MFEDIEIRYYKFSDVFFSEKATYNDWHFFPKILTDILGINTSHLTTDICYPYIDDMSILDYESLKKDRNYLNDKLVVVAVQKKRVVGISIFKIFSRMVYLSVFCIEKIVRKTGFAQYFLKNSIGLVLIKYKLPIILVSTEEGYNLYKKEGFVDIEYANITKYDTRKYLSWFRPDGDTIGKYLMIYNSSCKKQRSKLKKYY